MRLLFLGFIASLFFISCDKNDSSPNDLPQTEGDLKSAIQQEWNITTSCDYKTITFRSDNTYNILKNDGTSIGDIYTIEKDLRTLSLKSLGKLEITTLSANSFSFILTVEEYGDNINLDCIPASVNACISEIQLEIDGEYLPETQFIYDQGILKEVVVSSYYNNNATDYFQNKYVFETDSEMKITAVNRFVKPKDITEWTLTAEYEISYQNGNISRIKEHEHSVDQYFTYHYSWSDGKVIKLEQENEKEILISYTDGNFLGDETSGIKIDDGKYEEHHNKRTNEFNATQKNYFQYVPIEYIMVSDPSGLKKFIPFSDNNCIRIEDYTIKEAKDRKTNQKIFTLEYNYLMSYDYLYKDGRTESFTVTSVENYKYTDFIEPSKSVEKIKDTDIRKYKIKYIGVE